MSSGVQKRERERERKMIERRKRKAGNIRSYIYIRLCLLMNGRIKQTV